MPLPPLPACTDRPDIQNEITRAYAETTAPASLIVLCGLPASGKTAEALRWAHSQRERFTHVLFADFTPDPARWGGRGAVDNQMILAELLSELGIGWWRRRTWRGPLHELYRTMTSSRSVLVIADHVDHAATARWLMPTGQGNALLVTSRNVLSGLALDDAHFINVPTSDYSERRKI